MTLDPIQAHVLLVTHEAGAKFAGGWNGSAAYYLTMLAQRDHWLRMRDMWARAREALIRERNAAKRALP